MENNKELWDKIEADMAAFRAAMKHYRVTYQMRHGYDERIPDRERTLEVEALDEQDAAETGRAQLLDTYGELWSYSVRKIEQI
jgi:hypothetical protein